MQQQLSNQIISLEKAEALVSALKAGKEAEAEQLIYELSNLKESHLFVEVGRLTRELHEAINGFLLDSRITDMTNVEIPDAKERLSYVITITQNSADRTLTAVEQSLPIIEDFSRNSESLLRQWEMLRARLLKKDDFMELSDSLMVFLTQARQDSVVLHKNLSDVLMAQDFQDLTGQIISKVINLVHDVEEKLVKLICITGGKMESNREDHRDPRQLEGPAVPGIDQGDQITSQDEVDDLLSSLGF